MLNKIKVAHIITMLELGGAQSNTLYTVSNLDKSKFEVILVSGKGGILDKKINELAGVKTYFIDSLVRPINPLKDFSALLSIYKILLAEKPDIVHTHSSKAGILGRLAAKIAKTKIILHTFHGFGFNDFQGILRKTVFVLIEKLIAPISNKLIFVSEQNILTAKKEKIGNKNQYLLIRSGIKTSIYKKKYIDSVLIKKQLSLPLDSKVITNIAPFKPQKNLVDFISMAKIVSDKYKNSVFLIIGDGIQRPLIEEKIAEFNLQERVFLPGWRTDIAEILSITDIFAMTSLWEGLPRSAVEAFVCAKPVVSYAVDGINDVLKDGSNGYLVKPKDVNAISEKILLLLNSPELYKMMSTNAANTIDITFDIDYMVKQQEELYNTL
ncbi:MAG: hypothetical protein A2252_06175 [Elusimicrobia bacterium RIFOXYA2_FULL_39_19]|nr:MAG: hypothetical protein A2252_06175 [Elusimicrobia bacterium RIFOXYA2_FULL_39_19]